MDYKDTIMSNDRPHFTTMEELKHLWELGLMVNQYPISRMSWVTRKDGGDIMIIIPGCKADLICPIAPNSKYFDIEGNLRPEYTMIPAYSVEDLMCLLPNNFKVSKYTQEGETLYKLEMFSSNKVEELIFTVNCVTLIGVFYLAVEQCLLMGLINKRF